MWESKIAFVSIGRAGDERKKKKVAGGKEFIPLQRARMRHTKGGQDHQEKKREGLDDDDSYARVEFIEAKRGKVEWCFRVFADLDPSKDQRYRHKAA